MTRKIVTACGLAVSMPAGSLKSKERLNAEGYHRC